MNSRRFLQDIGLFLLLMGIFFLFSVLSCCLPERNLQDHVRQASNILHKKGNYPYIFPGQEASRMDNFTDALILNQAYHLDRRQPIRSAMRMPRHETEPAFDQVEALYRTTHGDTTLTERTYTRYWHGSTSLYRYMLALIPYPVMLWLMVIVTTLLWVCFIVFYYPRGGLCKTLVLPLSGLLVYSFLMPQSLQFFPVLAIALTASILILGEQRNIARLLFITACATCYFDLLTIPLITFGWPVLVWLSIQEPSSLSWRKTPWQFVQWGICWVLGYGLTFVTKWLLGSWVLGADVWQNATDAVTLRVSTGDFSRWDAVMQNVQLLPTPWCIAVIALFLLLALVRFCAPNRLQLTLTLLMALLPYLWYMAASNHSYLHYWFTYRLQAVSIAAILMAILCFRGEERILRKKR